MKLPVLSGFLVVCATTVFAQTGSPQPPAGGVTPAAQSNQTVTLTGCVGGGTGSQPFMLNNPMVLPQTGAAGVVPPVATTPPTGSATAGVPTSGAAGIPPTPAATPPSTAVGSSGAAGATGTAGTAGSAGTAGTAAPTGAATGTGTTGAAGVAGAAGTAGTVPPAAAGSTGTPGSAAIVPPAGAGGSAGFAGMNGYRLSGTDMSSWAGQRVQITGTLVPSTTAGSATPGTVAVPEFRVQSVQPIAGPCPRP